MAFLHAYFDESGKQNDHPVVTFTGVCISQSKLKDFDDAWNILLQQYEIRSLHMAKASRTKEKNGPKMPRHQPIEERIAALKPFSDCINDHFEVGLAQAIDVRGFAGLTEEAKRGLGSPDDPYYIAFLRGVLEVLKYVQGDDKISLICDDDESTAWDCYRHYRGIRRAHEGVRRNVVSLTFANDKHFPALQAADMLAFLSRLQAKKEFYGDFNQFGTLFSHLVTERGPGHTRWFRMFADEAKLISINERLMSIGKTGAKRT